MLILCVFYVYTVAVFKFTRKLKTQQKIEYGSLGSLLPFTVLVILAHFGIQSVQIKLKVNTSHLHLRNTHFSQCCNFHVVEYNNTNVG